MMASMINILLCNKMMSKFDSKTPFTRQMSRLQEDFSKFYHSKYSGRKLRWQHSLGHCIIKAHFSAVGGWCGGCGGWWWLVWRLVVLIVILAGGYFFHISFIFCVLF